MQKIKTMKVFMIGGTGLLGCEAAIELIKMGHQVKSVALPPLPQGAPIPKEMELNEEVEIEVENINLPELKCDFKVCG